ncbi:hypothetical protein HOY82DRAFT_73210 [Tuber indicum]|nr:hypothetical protein HOY82DRAFT_73210 [Tuber indicum]
MVGMGVFTSLDRFRNGLSLLGFCGISCVIGNQSIPPITVEGRCSGFRLVPNVERLGGSEDRDRDLRYCAVLTVVAMDWTMILFAILLIGVFAVDGVISRRTTRTTAGEGCAGDNDEPWWISTSPDDVGGYTCVLYRGIDETQLTRILQLLSPDVEAVSLQGRKFR